MYDLASAAAAAGINKSTVLRSIRAGRISATKTESGWQISPAEFHRVFPPLPAPATAEQPAVHQDATSDELVRLLREQLTDMRGQLSDLRQDRDHWREAFQAAQRQLPAPAAVGNQADEPRNRWRRTWRWLRSTG